MTVYCPTFDEYFAPPTPVKVFEGEEAGLLQQEWEALLSHYTAPRLQPLVLDIEELFLDAASAEDIESGAVPVDAETAAAAIAFARLLPRSLPAPEVSPEADGEISFDWVGPHGKIFSASISRTGRIAFAGRFGDRSKLHGTEQLSEACPAEIVRGIAKVYS